MKVTRMMRRFLLVLIVLFPLGGEEVVVAAEAPQVDVSKRVDEMPVLTGEFWQTMSRDAKIAFVWGVGHVVTIEENVIKRHPELRRVGFVSKLSEGLSGVPMNSIIQTVDDYYRQYPDRVQTPVMRVIWGQLVRPKLRTGVNDRPVTQQEEP